MALIPVAIDALGQFRHATSHVIVALPTFRDLRVQLKFGIILICGAGAFVLGRFLHWPRAAAFRWESSVILIAAWWLVQPLALFAVSRFTGSSMFVARYLYIGLPGAALAATLAAAYFIPPDWWKPLSRGLRRRRAADAGPMAPALADASRLGLAAGRAHHR